LSVGLFLMLITPAEYNAVISAAEAPRIPPTAVNMPGRVDQKDGLDSLILGIYFSVNADRKRFPEKDSIAPSRASLLDLGVLNKTVLRKDDVSPLLQFREDSLLVPISLGKLYAESQ